MLDSDNVTVIFVLGGPGAGKGTQSALLVDDFAFTHLSAGDLLRQEQHREGSQFGHVIQKHIKDGTIVPMEITIRLLQNAMLAAIAERASQNHPGWSDRRGRFLIDGFPRKMDQAIMFEDQVCPSSLVLFFSTTEQVMLARLLERGKTSGREDDNEESIKKRFRTYYQETMPVIDYFAAKGKVAQIDSSRSVEEIHRDASERVAQVLGEPAPQVISS